MKLERLVFGWTGDARWMDAYERALFNCRLGTQNGQGLKQYFFPLAAGYWRAYHTPEESFWCCTGTGVEEFAKFADTIYFHRGSDVYVNQFIASTLDWNEEGLIIEQVTQFPSEQGTTLKVKSSRPTCPHHPRPDSELDNGRRRGEGQRPRSRSRRRSRIVSRDSQSLARRRHDQRPSCPCSCGPSRLPATTRSVQHCTDLWLWLRICRGLPRTNRTS